MLMLLVEVLVVQIQVAELATEVMAVLVEELAKDQELTIV